MKTASSGIADDDAALVRLSYEEEKAPPVDAPVVVAPVVVEVTPPPEVEASRERPRAGIRVAVPRLRKSRNPVVRSRCPRVSRCRSCPTSSAVRLASSCANW